RTGGYHLLHTLFQEIDFCDEITLSTGSDDRLTMEITGPLATQVPVGDDNLCLQAARRLQEVSATAKGTHIKLHKWVPLGAGLGGGSSDAAAVLKGLNALWQLGLLANELEKLAVRLGADVPFFIRGGLQLGEGIGEQLTAVNINLPYTVVLGLPSFGVDTAWAYRQFTGRQQFPEPPRFDRLIKQKPIPWSAFTNDIETVVFPHHPELADIKQRLFDAGAVYAGLSGSGSAVVGLFDKVPGATLQLEEIPDCRVVLANMVGSAEHDLDSP
ncbi:MAG: 4-(cytidine 5'-diphospho)-2-C-methyl-D-erythritol kinase, partial [Candidatus Neomarinimicrobiota bacterium]